MQVAQVNGLEECNAGDLGTSLGSGRLRPDELLRDIATAPTLRALARNPEQR